MKTKTVVAYFSATGTTAAVARTIADAAGADLLEIKPETPYTPADLDWTQSTSRSSREQADTRARPALAAGCPIPTACDTLYVGFPIWWDDAPRVVYTFLDRCRLKGVRVIPFATSGSSGIEPAARKLQKTYAEAQWQPGRLLNRTPAGDIAAWVAKQ